MRVHGIDFGHVFNASGARGFYKEGYAFHGPLKRFGLDYEGSTFVAKTTTFYPRLGNMELDVYHQPVETFPKCIVVKPFAGVTLNAVGLSGPGIQALHSKWRASELQEPWMMSIMAVGATVEERVEEIKKMLDYVVWYREGTFRNIGLQINLSCPNTNHDVEELLKESKKYLDECDPLNTYKFRVPVFLKVNAVMSPSAAFAAARHTNCAGLICSNSIPWGRLPEDIDWEGLFGSKDSPLIELGGGGLSGKPLLPIVRDWIAELRDLGFTGNVVGGGGVLSVDDADELLDAGATAIELGSVSILRPWRVASIIRHVNNRLSEDDNDNGNSHSNRYAEA